MSVLRQPVDIQPYETSVVDSGLQRTFSFQEVITVQGQDVTLTTEIPSQPITDAVAYIIPGFGGIKASSDPLRYELARCGITTVSYSPTRKGATYLSDLLRPQDLHAETIDHVGQATANNLARYQKQAVSKLPIDPFRKILVPHSMGGLAAVNHAQEHPEYIDALVNLAAAGYGSPRLGALAADVPRGLFGGIWHELRPFAAQHSRSQARELAATILHYYGSNPLRTIGEIQSCLSEDKRPIVKDLGVRVAYLAFKHDILIPPSEKAVQGTVEEYYEFDNMGHLGPQVKPAQIARKVVQFAVGYDTRLRVVS